MVETNPFDEDLDDEDPYNTTLDSDDEAAQLRTVSQEDDQNGDEVASPKSVNFATGSKSPTSGAGTTTSVASSQKPPPAQVPPAEAPAGRKSLAHVPPEESRPGTTTQREKRSPTTTLLRR